MISKDQAIERMKKVRNILNELNNSNSIKEISEKTKIPTSSIQRYLNNNKLLKECGLTDNDVGNINTWLSNSKKSGLSKGGKNSQEKYTYDRNETGHFTGIKK